MSSPKKTVLITGCSDGSLGAGLAIAFHKAGLKVYATSRNPAKMKGLEDLGIETLKLDVLDDTSIAKIANKITQLDILGK
jgi:1-acylglycerone phosphate reductase